MEMEKYPTDKFLSYISPRYIDEQHVLRMPVEVFVYRPMNIKGKPGTYIIAVLHDILGEGVYSAVTKCDLNSDEFNYERGLGIVFNRLWCEYHGIHSNYGRDHSNIFNLKGFGPITYSIPQKLLAKRIAYFSNKSLAPKGKAGK